MTGSQPLRLFVVEDNEIDAELIRRAAPKHSEIVWARSGAECRRLFPGLDPDCILLDYRLPEETGLDLLPLLAAGRAPVILMSGLCAEQVVSEALRLGAKAFVKKEEISRRTLPRFIRRVLVAARSGGPPAVSI